jgi:hypothetical protein
MEGGGQRREGPDLFLTPLFFNFVLCVCAVLV